MMHTKIKYIIILFCLSSLWAFTVTLLYGLDYILYPHERVEAQQAYLKAESLLQQKTKACAQLQIHSRSYKNYFDLWGEEQNLAPSSSALKQYMTRVAWESNVTLRETQAPKELGPLSSKFTAIGDFNNVFDWLWQCERSFHSFRILSSTWTLATSPMVQLTLILEFSHD